MRYYGPPVGRLIHFGWAATRSVRSSSALNGVLLVGPGRSQPTCLPSKHTARSRHGDKSLQRTFGIARWRGKMRRHQIERAVKAGFLCESEHHGVFLCRVRKRGSVGVTSFARRVSLCFGRCMFHRLSASAYLGIGSHSREGSGVRAMHGVVRTQFRFCRCLLRLPALPSTRLART